MRIVCYYTLTEKAVSVAWSALSKIPILKNIYSNEDGKPKKVSRFILFL